MILKSFCKAKMWIEYLMKRYFTHFFITNYSENEVAINFTSDKNINVEVEFTGEKEK